MHKDSLPIANLQKARKLSSLTIDQLGDRRVDGRKVWEKTLSDVFGVAAWSWPRRIEQFGGRK